jgi:hypothetical protein
MAGSQLTRLLIDGGNSLNLLFASTLKKIGLDISKMLTPSRAPFFGIVLGNVATLLGSVVLPVTLGTKDNYRTEYIKFEVTDFEVVIPRYPRQTSIDQIHGRASLCLLTTQDAGKIGVLTFRGNLKKSYNCDQEAIEYAVTSRVPEPSAEVFAAAQKLTDSAMEISNQSPS